MLSSLLVSAALALGAPAATANPGPVVAPGTAAEVRAARELVVSWRDAWERRDLDAFGVTIAKSYRAGDLDREALLAQKKGAFEKATRITVGMEDVDIQVEGERATVAFRQTYVSDRHSDRGRKTLVLAKEEGSWRIVSESFEPSR